jgi:hypothetical protein
MAVLPRMGIVSFRIPRAAMRRPRTRSKICAWKRLGAKRQPQRERGLVRRQSDALKNKKPAVGTSAERGHRAETPDYASIYIFRAISLRDCKGAALVTPRCGNEAMKLHLAEIATQIAPALLFKAALEAIDFKVTGLAGRVRGADAMNPPLQRQERTLDEGIRMPLHTRSPKTAFSCFPTVHRIEPEGPLRVDSTRSSNPSAMSAIGVLR